MIKQTFQIPEMHCPNCVMHLQELEDELPGVVRVDGSYQKQRITVEYDEKKTTVAQIRSMIKELGYSAT
jgi:copper chaperone CopZ